MGQDEAFRAWLNLGGQRQARRGVAGGAGLIPVILDAKLQLTAAQRTVGQCYGAYVEQATIAGGSAFMKERVDGGANGAGGNTENAVQIMRMVEVAHYALSCTPPLIYTLGKRRGDGARGDHWPIKARFIADSIAVHGYSLQWVCLHRSTGWWVERKKPDGQAFRAVPDRQRKNVARALRDALDTIDAAWAARGWYAPAIFGEDIGADLQNRT